MVAVDLSHVLKSGIQVYPGDPEVVIIPALSVGNDLVNVQSIHMGSQSGTHVDSPWHVIEHGLKLDQISLEHFFGRAVIVDATGLHPRQEIPHERFQAAEIDSPRIIIVKTRWSHYFGSSKYLEHPFPSLKSLQYLLDKGVRTIALDFLSLDRTPGDGEEFTLQNHYLWSSAGGVIGENFTNIDAINFPDIWLSMLPLNLGDVDGAPVRAVAIDGKSL